MDVLEYWKPSLDGSKFRQGQISDEVWRLFWQLVQLSHAFKYWQESARDYRPSRADTYYGPETRYARDKRRSGDRAERETLTNHKFRAAYLASERLNAIVSVVQSRQDTPDWRLALALVSAVGPQVVTNAMQGHERTDFSKLAVDDFDAEKELETYSDGSMERWRPLQFTRRA